MIIYSKNSGVNNAAFGKIELPIKMVIENESDILTKKGGIRDWLFNVEKSNRFGETIVIQDEFGAFTRVAEGNVAENDTIHEVHTKFIEHVQFMKEFALTAEMMELIESGYGNIVCAQPFGCLPNHIVGKGMMKPIKEDQPEVNLVAIDYDAGATKINQDNRIKLMLANAGK